MRRGRWIGRGAVAAAVILALTLSAGSASSVSGEQALKIGTLLPETGSLQILGPPMVQAVRMAVQEVNAAGGVNDLPIELVERDDGTDPDVASAAADDLIADDVHYVVGAAASGVTTAVIDKLRDTDVAECSPSNTGVQFTTYPDRGNYFRTAPPDNLQSIVLSNLIVDGGYSDVVIVARSDEYGEGFARFLRKELRSAGANVQRVVLYDPEATSFDDVVQRIADENPEAVALIAFDEGGPIVQAAIEQGVGPQDLQWFGTDGIQSSTFYQKVDPSNPGAVLGIRGTAPSAAPAGGESTFRQRFEAFAPGVDTIYSGHAYDCVVIGALAAQAVGRNTAAAIRRNINAVTKGGEKCTLYSECLALLEDGEDIDYDGAAGPLDFVKKGEPGVGEYDTWEFDPSGKVTVIDESIKAGGTT